MMKTSLAFQFISADSYLLAMCPRSVVFFTAKVIGVSIVAPSTFLS